MESLRKNHPACTIGPWALIYEWTDALLGSRVTTCGKGIHWRFAGLYERIHLDSSTWELIFGENVLQERSQRSAEINIRYVDYPRICIDVCSGTKLFWRKHKDLVLLTLVHCTKASQLPLKKQKEIRKSVKINFFEINLSRSFRTLPKNSLAKYELQTRRFQLDPLIQTAALSEPSMNSLTAEPSWSMVQCKKNHRVEGENRESKM